MAHYKCLFIIIIIIILLYYYLPVGLVVVNMHFGKSDDHLVSVIVSSNIHCTVSEPTNLYSLSHVNVTLSKTGVKFPEVGVTSRNGNSGS